MDLREQITLEPDPVWTHRFEAERERIRSLADEGLLGVYHVGSTAIPDVPGKPALDVIAVYEDDESMQAAAETLATDGYELYSSEPESALVIEWNDDGAVFLKLHTPDDGKVRNQVIFRDYLRDHPEARREYEAVKREAAREHPEDEEAYTRAKTEVVDSLLRDAHEAGYGEDLPEFL